MTFPHHFNVSVAALGKAVQTAGNSATLELPWVPEVLFLFLQEAVRHLKLEKQWVKMQTIRRQLPKANQPLSAKFELKSVNWFPCHNLGFSTKEEPSGTQLTLNASSPVWTKCTMTNKIAPCKKTTVLVSYFKNVRRDVSKDNCNFDLIIISISNGNKSYYLEKWHPKLEISVFNNWEIFQYFLPILEEFCLAD